MRDFHLPGRSQVLAENAMAATSHPLATLTALEVLRRGGNAMDAAISGAVLLGFCEPAMTGLGGDAFVLWTRPGSNEVLALNGSGRAPAAASAEALRSEGLEVVPPRSAAAVTVPGAVDAFCRLAETEGRIGLDAILAPAIRYAEEGVPVAPRVAWDWARTGDLLQGHGRRWFLNNGRPFALGERFRAPGQAEVLRRVARHGRSAFYEGEVAEDMVASLRALGGVHTLEDFAATEATPTKPVSGIYRGHELLEHPPNTHGATAILMLNILSHFDLARLDPFGAERAHLEAEAARLAYDARDRFIGDPETTTRLGHMLAPGTAAELAALIDPDRVSGDIAPRTEAVHRETIYITVVDRDRMAVSLIYSIFHDFGSGIASEKFGILFQNRGAAFSLVRGHPNELGPRKRPMHTIIPAMLRLDGQVVMPFGVMGGQYQPTGHVRVLTNMIDFGLDPQAAIDAPRSFAAPGELRVERGYPDAVRARLAAMGHNVVIPEVPIGGAQAIRIHPSGVLEGASDPRKDGCALGW